MTGSEAARRRSVTPQRKLLVVLGRGDVENLAGMFVVARHARSDREVRTTRDQQLGGVRISRAERFR